MSRRSGPVLDSRQSAPFAALDLDELALFLDLDGTLVELVSDPADAEVGAGTIAMLRSLEQRLGGALAIVSGRPIAEVDRVLRPLQLTVVGLHGLEWRERGQGANLQAIAARLEPARTVLGWALAGRPRLWLEDKGATLAVHFREAPGEGPYVAQLVDAVVARLGPEFECVSGAFVKEIRPRACNKGTAVRRLMGMGAFAGRIPAFVGDDVTDLDAFREVEALGGRTISVGDRIRGQHRLADPNDVFRWLSRLVQA